jgi:predicted phosphodiesterase
MRLAILADIHSNLPALEAVLEDAERTGIDGTLIAGDHLTGGPCPVGTIRALRALDAHIIRGNTDDRLLAYHTGDVPDAWRTSEQWAGLRWLYGRLDEEALGWLACLPEQCVVSLQGTTRIRVVHGTPWSTTRHLAPDRSPGSLQLFERAGILPAGRDPDRLGDTLSRIDEPVLVCGHSHIPWVQGEKGRLALNPGSVGAPVSGDVRAQYALLTWQDGRWQVEHRAVPYDLERARRAYREGGLLEEAGPVARAFLLNVETGLAVFGLFVRHVRMLAAEAGAERDPVVPVEVWEQAISTFDWAAYEEQRTDPRGTNAREQCYLCHR